MAEDDACMTALGPLARMPPITRGHHLAQARGGLVLDGPFAESKEQLLGFYIVDCEGLAQAIEATRDLAHAGPKPGAYEIRPLAVLRPGAAGA
jgi:hypothetical protein